MIVLGNLAHLLICAWGAEDGGRLRYTVSSLKIWPLYLFGTRILAVK